MTAHVDRASKSMPKLVLPEWVWTNLRSELAAANRAKGFGPPTDDELMGFVAKILTVMARTSHVRIEQIEAAPAGGETLQ